MSGEPLGAAPVGPVGPVGPSTVIGVRFGTPALGALAGVVRAVKRPDPLAPVTVVVGSAHIGVSVRRHLARLGGPDGRVGLVNVQWRSLDEVAELLAGPALVAAGTPVLSGPLHRAAVRVALDEAPGWFAPVAGNPATERSLATTLAELRELEADDLDRLAATGSRARAVIELHHRVRATCRGFADRRDVLDRAFAALGGLGPPGEHDDGPGAPPGVEVARQALGHLVVYLPERLAPIERRLLGALAGRGPISVLLGRTGDPAVDQSADELHAQLVRELGAHAATVDPGVLPAVVPPTLVRAPDAEEEVRIAVRRVLAALEDGVAPEDVAVVSRVASPYDTLLHEQLGAAGIDHHAPSSLTLAQTVAGRTLVGFLPLADRGFRRSELFRWLRSAPIRLADGRRVPRSFDRAARRAGVSVGLDQWHQRLDRRAAELAEQGEARQYDLRDIGGLRALLDELAERSVPPVEQGWGACADWAIGLLERFVGSRTDVTRGYHPWPDHELDAYDRVVRALEELGALSAIEPTLDAARFRRVLDEELARPVRSAGSFGHGVFVGRVDDLVGARHDLVIVVGMAEGWFPPRGQGDPLLPDHERRVLDGRLADRRRRPADEQRSFLAALAAAPHRQLSFPRVDRRSQRELMPARAFLHQLAPSGADAPVRADALDQLGLEPDRIPRLVDVPSFAAVADARGPALTEHEAAYVQLRHGARPDAALARGIAAVQARSLGVFSEWTGAAGADHAPRFTGEGVGSSTSFEQWATCPFRYFLNHVLHVHALDDRPDADRISGLDRGSLVHGVLEQFIERHLDRPADQPWSAEDHAELQALARELADEYEQQGLTGRTLLWEVERDRIERRLTRILEVDQSARAHHGVRPIGVELRFGGNEDDSAPPVVVDLAPGRSVAFRGMIDRIDRDPGTGALVVIDYKTGKDGGYALDDDITSGGRHLQLVIYGEAARQAFGGDDVAAYFWFVEMKHSTHRVGGPIGEAERARFREVLDVITSGIEAGQFPANPGAESFWGFDHCGFCDFNRICPTTRGDQWERVRLSPAIHRYRELTEPAPAGGAS